MKLKFVFDPLDLDDHAMIMASPTSTPKFSKLFVLNLFEFSLSLKTDKTQKARMTRTSPSTTNKRETHANQSTLRSLVWVGPPKAHFQDPQTCVVLWMLPPLLSLCVSFSHSHSHFHTLPYLWNSETQTPHVCVINKLMLIVPLKFLSLVRLRSSTSSTFQTSIIFLRTVSCQSSKLSQHIFCLQLLHSPYTNNNSCSAMLIKYQLVLSLQIFEIYGSDSLVHVVKCR